MHRHRAVSSMVAAARAVQQGGSPSSRAAEDGLQDALHRAAARACSSSGSLPFTGSTLHVAGQQHGLTRHLSAIAKAAVAADGSQAGASSSSSSATVLNKADMLVGANTPSATAGWGPATSPSPAASWPTTASRVDRQRAAPQASAMMSGPTGGAGHPGEAGAGAGRSGGQQQGASSDYGGRQAAAAAAGSPQRGPRSGQNPRGQGGRFGPYADEGRRPHVPGRRPPATYGQQQNYNGEDRGPRQQNYVGEERGPRQAPKLIQHAQEAASRGQVDFALALLSRFLTRHAQKWRQQGLELDSSASATAGGDIYSPASAAAATGTSSGGSMEENQQHGSGSSSSAGGWGLVSTRPQATGAMQQQQRQGQGDDYQPARGPAIRPGGEPAVAASSAARQLGSGRGERFGEQFVEGEDGGDGGEADPVASAAQWSMMLARRVHQDLMAHVQPPQAAEKVLRALQARGVSTDDRTYHAAVQAVSAAGDWQTAERLLREMQEVCGTTNLYATTALCKALAAAGHAPKIEELISSLRRGGIEPNPHVWTQLIKAYATLGDLPTARGVLVRLLREGVQPNSHMFRALIYGYGMRGHAEAAVTLLDDMQRLGYTPDLRTYGAAINACAEVCLMDEVDALLKEVEEKGLQPNTRLYNAVLKAWSRAGDSSRAHALLQRMEASGPAPDHMSYAMLAQAHAKRGEPAGARDALLRSVQRGLPPSVAMYTSLVNAYGEAGDLGGARTVLLEMEALRIRPNSHTWTSLINWAGVKGSYMQARSLYKDMVDSGVRPNHITYLSLVETAMRYWAADKPRRLGALVSAERMYLDQAMPLLPPPFGTMRYRMPELRNSSHSSSPPSTTTAAAASPTAAATTTTAAAVPSNQPPAAAPRSVQLDVHGFSHYTVQLALLSGLRRLADWHEAGELEEGTGFEVITGKGLRSVNRRAPVIRGGAMAFLENAGLEPSIDTVNEGVVVVDSGRLWQLLRSVQAQQQEGEQGIGGNVSAGIGSSSSRRFSARSYVNCFVDPLTHLSSGDVSETGDGGGGSTLKGGVLDMADFEED